MDIELAQTFLAVVSAGSFVRAAERLHVTQAAVSARVQGLERELGRRLFVRNKAGAHMTAAGQEFFPFATELVQVWERARHQVALRPGREAVLSLGGEFSLWSALILNWMITLRSERPAVALRTYVDTAERLLGRVQSGSLDIAVMYTPHQRPGIEIAPMLEEELIAVTTLTGKQSMAVDTYIFVDWGPDFTSQHDAAFPGLRDAGLHVGLGPLALRYLLLVGGTGYFRTRAVQRYLKSGELKRVAGTPKFSYSAYAAYSTRTDPKLIDWARRALVKASKTLPDQWV
jgi:LysR family transcriptional regulator, flagellar master operon regulator